VNALWVLKPGGRLIIQDSLQRDDQKDYEGLLQLLPRVALPMCEASAQLDERR
jgi:hypothetical protein